MFKQINSQASTKQIRKTKLLDSYHNNATNTLRNKIMLTDLCPEQKAKIGDLVRTLETRKSQNNTLEQRIKQLQKRQKKHVDKIQQLQKIIQEGRQKQLKLKEQLTLVKIKEQERQRYIQHLLAEKQQKQQQLLKIKKVACVDQFSLTDPVITFNQGVQAIPKKKKQKQTQVQTQINNMNQQGKRYPNNSRSFQKIMRGARVHSHGNQTNSAARSGNKNKFKDDKNRPGQRFKKSQIIINDQQDEQNQQIQSSENNQQVQLNQDDDFNQLAKKWLELKQKNMSKIKQSYKKSKQKVSNDKSIKKVSKSIGIPRQFNQKVVPQHQEQEQSFTNHENNLHHNESFGPKKSKKKQRRKQTQQIQEQEHELDKDFDQIELNKILKLKNFSASRLLSKNHQLSSQQSDRQKQKYNRYQNDKRQQKKLRKSNNMRIQQHQNTPNMKISGVSNSRSNNIDFYETDLLDIVSSINRK